MIEKQIEHIKDVKSIHDLIVIAISDARATMKVDGFRAYYFDWCRVDFAYSDNPSAGGHKECTFCLAGAVIAGSANHSVEKSFQITDFDQGTISKLEALDSIREMDWATAYMCFYNYEYMDLDPNPAASVFEVELNSSLLNLKYKLFKNNEELHRHLSSLEKMLPVIKEAEQKALEVKHV